MFKKKRVVLDSQEAIWYSHVRGIVSLTRKAEKILAGEDLDIKPECKQINDHSIKIDSKEIVQNSNHTLFA